MKSILLLALTASLGALAQDIPVKQIRFIPLGQLPDHEEEKKDGIRIQKTPREGTVPPDPVCISLKPEEVSPLGFRLDRMTVPFKVQGNVGGIKLHKGKAAAGKAWFESKLPAATRSLGVLYRDHKTMKWGKPGFKLVPDDHLSFPAGKARFINVSNQAVRVKMGEKGKVITVKPGETKFAPMKVGANFLKVYAKNREGKFMKMIFENNIHLKEGERLQTFLYKAQLTAKGKTPSRPVVFVSHSERAL